LAWTAWTCWGTRPRAVWLCCTRLLTRGGQRHLILLTLSCVRSASRRPTSIGAAALARRSGEPWYLDALGAIEKAEAESMDNWRAYMPFFQGRWDDVAQAHLNIGISERSGPAQDGFGAAHAFNPAAARETVGRLAAPVLVYAGEFDADRRPQPRRQARRSFRTPR
jgi:hypothetical protein